MTFMLRPHWPTAAARALDLAEALLRRAEAGAPPPAVSDLPARPRATYDRLLDAVNRLPRPVMVMGSLALLGSALIAPDWFAARMEALSDMPEALWWIIGAVMSLHFGARYQDRSQAFQRDAAAAAAPHPAEPVRLADPDPASPGTDAELALDTLTPGPNPALSAWAAQRRP